MFFCHIETLKCSNLVVKNENIVDFRGFRGYFWANSRSAMADEQDIYHREKPSLSLKYYSITRQRLQLVPHPVGKSYASIVDDEKTSFLGRIKTKNPATFIIAGFPAMDGQRRLWIDTKFLDFCVLAVYNSIRKPV
jgi:hypothetical protein